MFSWVISARLRLSGCYSAICENLLSAVRSNGRKAFAMLMFLFMGVTPVFVVPVFAVSEGNFDYADGVVTVKRQLFGASNSPTFASYFFDNLTEQFTMNNGSYTLESDVKGLNDPFLTTGYYIDFTFSIASEGTLHFTHEDYGSYVSAALFENTTYNILHDFDETDELLITVFVDDVQKQLLTTAEKFVEESYPISHHLRVRISSNFINQEEFTFYESTNNQKGRIGIDLWLDASFAPIGSEEPTDPSDPSNPTDPSDPSGGGSGSQDLTEVIESIEVVQGHLEEINGNIVDIKDSVEDIKVQIEDTKDQLEDPTSPIWEAAGTKIIESVTSLFVPDEEELNVQLEDLETTVNDKLGDVVDVVERVDEYEEELVSSFTDDCHMYHFHFPGISVPLPDGMVTILPEQDVTIENKAFIVFRDLLGTGVAFLCGFAALHMIQDFYICLISGVSYWGWLRGRHDK